MKKIIAVVVASFLIVSSVSAMIIDGPYKGYFCPPSGSVNMEGYFTTPDGQCYLPGSKLGAATVAPYSIPNNNQSPVSSSDLTPNAQPITNQLEQRIISLENRLNKLELENADLKTRLTLLITQTATPVVSSSTQLSVIPEKPYVRYAGSGNVYDRKGNLISYEFASKNNIWNDIADISAR